MAERITVITHWYNEELLAPLFLRHYAYVDEIRVLLETDTTDDTRLFLRMSPNVVVEDVHCAGGFDEMDKAANINRAIGQIKEGWIYVVDADEFIFPEHFEDPQTFLVRQTASVVNAKLFFVFRHESDIDINYEQDPLPQRVHGLDVSPTPWHLPDGRKRLRPERYWMIKLIVFRASADVVMGLGNHAAGRIGEPMFGRPHNFAWDGNAWVVTSGNTPIVVHAFSDERHIGAHWKLADLEIAMRRRLSNHMRLSACNIKHGYTVHELNINEFKIKQRHAEEMNHPISDCLVKKI